MSGPREEGLDCGAPRATKVDCGPAELSDGCEGWPALRRLRSWLLVPNKSEPNWLLAWGWPLGVGNWNWGEVRWAAATVAG